MIGIILDTNVISEAVRPSPDPMVIAWFKAQDAERLHLTTTVVAELAQGIERLPAGRRRQALERWLRTVVEEDFAGRILVFDLDAALIYGRLVSGCLARGRTPKVSDAQIAAVAWRDRMAVATRDVGHFACLGVQLIDPWQIHPART